jgi:L-threonylcarbamoyladenylate synthase
MSEHSPIVPADNAGIARAVRLLGEGALVAIPTDTVYGLAVALDRPDALQRVFAVKGRAAAKTVPILLSDLAALPKVAAMFPPALERLAVRFWPGPLTIAVPARPGLPAEVLAADGTVGVRVPDNSIARTVIAGLGGVLAVTSANRSGELPATTVTAVVAQLGGLVDLVLDGGPTAGGVASSVVRVDDDGTLHVLRAGTIPREALERALAPATSPESP